MNKLEKLENELLELEEQNFKNLNPEVIQMLKELETKAKENMQSNIEEVTQQ